MFYPIFGDEDYDDEDYDDEDYDDDYDEEEYDKEDYDEEYLMKNMPTMWKATMMTSNCTTPLILVNFYTQICTLTITVTVIIFMGNPDIKRCVAIIKTALYGFNSAFGVLGKIL